MHRMGELASAPSFLTFATAALSASASAATIKRASDRIDPDRAKKWVRVNPLSEEAMSERLRVTHRHRIPTYYGLQPSLLVCCVRLSGTPSSIERCGKARRGLHGGSGRMARASFEYRKQRQRVSVRTQRCRIHQIDIWSISSNHSRPIAETLSRRLPAMLLKNLEMDSRRPKNRSRDPIDWVETAWERAITRR